MKLLCSGITRSLVAVAVSFALSASQSVLASNEQLEVIPDDTLFYLGTGQPVAVEDLFAIFPKGLDFETLGKMLPDVGQEDAELFQKIEEFLADPTAAANKWGFEDEIEFSAYTIGIMPVLRIAAEGEKFEAAFAKATADSEVTYDTITHKDINVRVYPLDDGSDEESTADKGPSAAELKDSMRGVERKLSNIEKDNQTAAKALDEANANLEAAKTENDASGIAKAANEIAEAAGKVSESSRQQSELEAELARLNTLAADVQTKLAAGGKSGPGVVTATMDKELVFALAKNAYDPEVLDQLLGLADFETTLEDSNKMKEIRSEWGYGDEMAGFVDMKLIADAVTGGDSLAAQQINSLTAGGENGDELKILSTDPCKAEIRQFAEYLPMIVSGNRRFDVSDDSVDTDSHFAVLLENEPLLNTLQLLRGAVPVSQSASEAMFSLGLGLSIDTAPQLSAQLTDLIGGIDYECELLEGLNSLAKTDISSLSFGAMMVSGMARGVKGVTFNMYDSELDLKSAIPVTGIDSAIAIAAEDPAGLVQSLRILPQMSILAELPLDGTPMSLNQLVPLPMPDGVEFFAAIKDKNIVIYSGDEAEDFANRLGGSGDEGFMFSSINTRKLINKFNDYTDQLPDVGINEELGTAAEFLKAYPSGNLSYKIDFTDKGIEVESVSQIDRPKK